MRSLACDGFQLLMSTIVGPCQVSFCRALRNLKLEGVIRTGNKGGPSVCLDMSRNCNASPSTS